MEPKSLTAVVHVKFHYGDSECKPVGEREIEMIGQLLQKASGLEPELQELLIKFAEFINQGGKKEDGQSQD